jgi:hypothetical protein
VFHKFCINNIKRRAYVAKLHCMKGPLHDCVKPFSAPLFVNMRRNCGAGWTINENGMFSALLEMYINRRNSECI